MELTPEKVLAQLYLSYVSGRNARRSTDTATLELINGMNARGIYEAILEPVNGLCIRNSAGTVILEFGNGLNARSSVDTTVLELVNGLNARSGTDTELYLS